LKSEKSFDEKRIVLRALSETIPLLQANVHHFIPKAWGGVLEFFFGDTNPTAFIFRKSLFAIFLFNLSKFL
jgi:hypothetical protein